MALTFCCCCCCCYGAVPTSRLATECQRASEALADQTMSFVVHASVMPHMSACSTLSQPRLASWDSQEVYDGDAVPTRNRSGQEEHMECEARPTRRDPFPAAIILGARFFAQVCPSSRMSAPRIRGGEHEPPWSLLARSHTLASSQHQQDAPTCCCIKYF